MMPSVDVSLQFTPTRTQRHYCRYLYQPNGECFFLVTQHYIRHRKYHVKLIKQHDGQIKRAYRSRVVYNESKADEARHVERRNKEVIRNRKSKVKVQRIPKESVTQP
jgi:hypothetical protein